jgi:arylsulfatase A-like enzyme
MKIKTLDNFLILCACMFFCSCSVKVEKEQAQIETRPNIIYIMADDLGYGDLGTYGQQKILTPNLDQMAADGLKFTQHYAGSTVCGPSRASLLTGKHTGHGTVRGNPRWTSTSKPVDIKPEEVTVAEELKRAGYTNGIIGKWGLAEASDASLPLNQGFDYFYGYRNHRQAHHYYPDTLYNNNTPFHPDGNVIATKEGQYAHDSLSSKALQFIEKNKNNPFFLYLAFTIPHYELTVPEDSKQPYLNLGWQERKMKMGHYRHDEEGHTTYAGMVARMDRDIGRLFDKLKELGLDDNTLVIFTSDNGHEFDRDFFNSNASLKGKKRDLYEGGIRIPFIARWPGKIKLGSVTEHISAFWDFLPTVCDIAKIEPSGDGDGISYLPTLLGNKNEQKVHDYLYWEFNEGQGPIQAIRKGKWKAVRFFNKPLELYNLKEDLGEEQNLAEDYPELIRSFDQLLNDARTENENFPLKPHPRVSNKF